MPVGKYAVLMGKTGQGKTTILECVCGLRHIEAGSICVDSVDVTNWLPGDRQIGYVPQDLALFPTLNVREHLEFALRLRKESRNKIKERVEELSGVLKIHHLLDRSIDGLSGGERQRVALGRSLAFEPSVLLLDEPLSALDESTRLEIQDLLREVSETSNVTTLHVTHRRDEAQALADIQLELGSDGIVRETE